MIFQPSGGSGGGFPFSSLQSMKKNILSSRLPGNVTINVPSGAKMCYVSAFYENTSLNDGTLVSTFLMPGMTYSTPESNISINWSGNSIITGFNDELGAGALVQATFFI